MNYDLALKLKQAGFPQPEREPFDAHKHEAGFVSDNDAYIPTLSELIEACGESLTSLGIQGGTNPVQWLAYSEPDLAWACSTPEEAVANLWLSLQDNK